MNPFNILLRNSSKSQILNSFQLEGIQLKNFTLFRRNEIRTFLTQINQNLISHRFFSLQKIAISNLPLFVFQFPWKSNNLFPTRSSLYNFRASDSTDKETKKHGPGPSISIKKAHYPGEFCWSCKNHLEPKNTLFCNSCDKILPTPEHADYFSLFHFPRKFELDEKKLDKQYQSMLRRVHPDKFQLKTKDELKISETNSSHLNQAYKILKDPVERIKKLKLEGIDVGEGAGTIDDQELLTEILEMQEKLEDVLSESEIQSIYSQNSEKLKHSIEIIRKAYDEQKDLESVKKESIKLQYLAVLQNQIKAKLPVS